MIENEKVKYVPDELFAIRGKHSKFVKNKKETRGRKKGFSPVNPADVNIEIGRVVNAMTFGVNKITNEKNIEKGVKPLSVLTVREACFELGISPDTFFYHLRTNKQAKEVYENLRESRRDYLREISENNIGKALNGEMSTLGEKDIIDYSFRLLERTDKMYNPKQVIEQTVEQIDFNRSTSDILSDIVDLIKK